MIEIKHLSKSYREGKNILNAIDVTFPAAGLYAIVGKSGSGKTTLLSLIGGMDRDYEGSLMVNGVELKSLSEKEMEDYRFAEISFVFQNFLSQENETVHENLKKALDIVSLENLEKEKRIDDVLAKVGLKDKKDQIFKDLSGGEKKRISLARGLLKNTPILLLDEPLSSLNLPIRKEITKILLQESKTRTVIFITHEESEIPLEASVFSIVNGKLISLETKALQEEKIETSPVPKEKRKKLSLASMFRFSLQYFRSQQVFFSIVLFSFVIALFSISFAFQLTTSISESLIASLSSYMDDNALVIHKKDTIYHKTEYECVDYQTLKRIQNDQEANVIDATEFYVTSLDDFFSNHQSVKISHNFHTMKLPNFNLNSFLYAPTIQEEQLADVKLEQDEVYLSLEHDSLRTLYFLLFENHPQWIEEKELETINNYLETNIVSVEIQAQQNDWKYYMEHSFRLKGILSGEKKVIVSDKLFHNHFVSDILHFKEKLPDETLDVPWVLNKLPGLILKKDRIGEFLSSFLKSPLSKGYTFEILKQNGYYQQDDKSTHNRILLYHDFTERLTISELQRFQEKYQDSIRKISYSTTIYGFTANGYISGFYKPFFFSRYKDKLNRIEDEYYQSDANLGSFQSSMMDVGLDVFKGDLLSSVNKDSVLFSPIDYESLCYGKPPDSYSEIGISVGLAKKLFGDPLRALDEKLYALTLDKTDEKGDSFINRFLSGSFVISGIYQDEDMKIIHDTLFPLAYLFPFGTLSLEDMHIEDAVIEVDTDKLSHEEWLKALKDFSKDLRGEFPMEHIVREIHITLRRLSLLFLLLAILCFCSCGFLLLLCLYLLIQKNKKNIAVLLSLGYHKKEIVYYYFFLSLLLGLICYILSLNLTIIVEITMKNTLSNLLNIYRFNLLPFVISFLSMLILCFLVSYGLSFKIKHISPKDTLLR